MIHFGSKSKPSSQGTEALDKKIKVISVVLVILILILAAGILYIVLSNSKESGACTVYSAESDNVFRLAFDIRRDSNTIPSVFQTRSRYGKIFPASVKKTTCIISNIKTALPNFSDHSPKTRCSIFRRRKRRKMTFSKRDSAESFYPSRPKTAWKPFPSPCRLSRSCFPKYI